jgi:hypothetical protein
MALSPRQLRLIAIFAGLNILLIVVGWIALVSPQRHEASAAAASAQAAQDQLNTLLGHGSNPATIKQPAIHTSCLYKLDTALPSQAHVPDLLFEINRVATASGVDVASISPQAAQATAMGYTVVPINLTLNGSYYKLTRFLHNLRMLVVGHKGCPIANGQTFGVTSVTLAPGTKTSVEAATVGVVAYYYGVTGGAAAPVSTTDTTTTTTTGS